MEAIPKSRKDISMLELAGDEVPQEGRSRILVVDDCESIRGLIRCVFDRSHSLTEAGDGFEALKALSRQDFDCVISDIQMPGMSGLELSRKVKERCPETKVVLMSASGPAYQAAARETGAEYYLSKPFNIEELLLAVRQ